MYKAHPPAHSKGSWLLDFQWTHRLSWPHGPAWKLSLTADLAYKDQVVILRQNHMEICGNSIRFVTCVAKSRSFQSKDRTRKRLPSKPLKSHMPILPAEIFLKFMLPSKRPHSWHTHPEISIEHVSKCLKMSQNVSKCLQMSQNVSKCLKLEAGGG